MAMVAMVNTMPIVEIETGIMANKEFHLMVWHHGLCCCNRDSVDIRGMLHFFHKWKTQL